MAAQDPASARSTDGRVLIVGCGYTGRRLARHLGKDRKVLGTVATQASLERLLQEGVSAVRYDLDHGGPCPIDPDWLEGAALCHLAPPPPAGASDERTRRLLAALPATPSRIVYLSTTGVYGDRGGDVVTERTPIDPTSDRARRRVDAETAIREWCGARNVTAVVLRVPGIYGPGRLPLERLRRREPVLARADAGPGNRIHVDDLVLACSLAITSPQARGIYNVGDGNHASSSEYFSLVASLAGLPAPREVTLAEARSALSPGMLSFLTESRRAATDRIREELGFVPRYEDLAAGIRASLLEQGPQGS